MKLEILKLASGEEVLGEIIKLEKRDGTFALKNPVQVVPHETAPGEFSIGFAPFMPYAKDKTVYIYADGVVGVCTPDESMEKEYDRIFGAGIIVPEKPSLILPGQ